MKLTVIIFAAAVGSAIASKSATVDPATLVLVNPTQQLPGPVTSISTRRPGIDPELFPGMKVYKDFKNPLPSSSDLGSVDNASCTQPCPDDHHPVCGTDGVTYDNSCKLGVASCKDKTKVIAKKSDGPCSS